MGLKRRDQYDTYQTCFDGYDTRQTLEERSISIIYEEGRVLPPFEYVYLMCFSPSD